VGRQAKVACWVDGARGDFAVNEFPCLSEHDSRVRSASREANFCRSCAASKAQTYPSLSFTTDLIQALFPTNDQSPLHLQELQNLCKRVPELLLGYSQNHSLRPSRVDKRTEDVEDGPEIQLSTDRSEMGQGGVVVGCKEEEEGRGREEGRKGGRGVSKGGSEGHEEVGRA
jgi:hypothetical protein